MIDPRLYRAAFIPVLLALLVAAFSLENLPAPLPSTSPPDAFTAQDAFTDLGRLAAAYPDRRPGSTGDEALATEVARRFRALRTLTVSVHKVQGQTIDGEKTLTDVYATRAGAPGPGLVVVAHRDAAGHGAEAELSGTAALLELAHDVADGRLNRTITFVSTSGGSGGAAGAAAIPGQLPGPADAVLVLGDVAGTAQRRPFVLGLSNSSGVAPIRLERTVESAIRIESSRSAGSPHALTQLARLAFPLTVGEQGELGRDGLSAVLLSADGERAPGVREAVTEKRMQVFGRSALRAISALDAGPDFTSGPQRVIVTNRKVLPGWALALVAAAFLIPVLLGALDAFARARRRRVAIVSWLVWATSAIVPFALAAAFAALLGVTGLIDVRPAAPVPAGAIPVHTSQWVVVAAIALVFALGWLVVRPLLVRVVPPPRGDGEEGDAVASALLLALTAALVWIVNPFAALLLVPAAHAWLWSSATRPALRRPIRVLLWLVGLAPFVVVAVVDARQLGYGASDGIYSAVLLVAGGHVGVLTWLTWSIVGGAGIAALLSALRRRRPVVEAVPTTTPSVRGPRSYAGPGSLGGTDSALTPRR